MWQSPVHSKLLFDMIKEYKPKGAAVFEAIVATNRLLLFRTSPQDTTHIGLSVVSRLNTAPAHFEAARVATEAN